MKSDIKELLKFDNAYKKLVIGTDEAGRGSAVGAVFASAVCFNNIDNSLTEKLSKLNDSKQLSKKRREELYDIIKSETVNATSKIDVEEIERDNILKAALHAMRNCVSEVASAIHGDNIIVLVDGCFTIPSLDIPQEFVIKGDGQSASIAAASILAKVERDRYIEYLSELYPQYGWQNNMGYLTQEHLDAIDKYGLTPYHRASFLEKHFASKAQMKLF